VRVVQQVRRLTTGSRRNWLRFTREICSVVQQKSRGLTQGSTGIAPGGPDCHACLATERVRRLYQLQA